MRATALPNISRVKAASPSLGFKTSALGDPSVARDVRTASQNSIHEAPLNNSVLTLPSADIAANPSPFKPIYHNPPTHLLINPTLALSIFWTILPNSTESWEIRNSLRYLRRELKTQGDPEDGIYWDHVSYRSVVVDLKPVGGSIEGIIERKDFEIVLDRVMAWMLVRGYVWFGGLLDTEGLGFGRVEFGILPRGLKG